MTKVPIDYDKHGHCVICHEDMLYTEIIDGKPQQRLGPKYTEHEYLLDDGSRMRVAICVDCKNTLKDDQEEYNNVMSCVINGWKHEIDRYSHWDEEKKASHMEKYSKLKIISRTEGLGNDVLKKKLEKFKEKKK